MKIAIIGGGLTGLTAAYRLSQAGQKVSVFEKTPALGGMASCFEVVPGCFLEIFYHHLFAGDQDIVSLIRELKLGAKLLWLESRMGVFLNSKIFPFDTPIDLLKFKPLPVVDRLRFGLVVLYLTKVKNWRPYEKITAEEWLVKNLGQNAFNIFWKPLLKSKFAEDWQKVSMAWFWGKLNLRGASRAGILERERLGYLDGSFQLLIDALEKNIREKGGSFQLSTQVKKISRDVNSGKLKVAVEDGNEYEFDKVVATIPSPLFHEIVPSLDQTYSELLMKSEYKAALCLVLTLKKTFSPVYWLNVPLEEFPFVGLIEHTNYIPKEKYGGFYILYITRYLDSHDPLYELAAKALLANYLPFLKKINADFKDDWVKSSFVFKNSYAQPVIGLNYSKKIPSMKTSVEGLYLANTTQIYPEDRGTNYSVKLGEKVSKLVLTDK